MTEKIYAGNGKEVETKFGKLLKLSFSKSDLEKLTSQLNNGWVNCVVKEKQTKVEGKPTHYLEVDLWKPREGAAGTTANPVVSGGATDDLPF
tara:strand:+ start:212 stop:487 length:276 start_codon:yes stop_codon:yes gene_type:complete